MGHPLGGGCDEQIPELSSLIAILLNTEKGDPEDRLKGKNLGQPQMAAKRK